MVHKTHQLEGENKKSTLDKQNQWLGFNPVKCRVYCARRTITPIIGAQIQNSSFTKDLFVHSCEPMPLTFACDHLSAGYHQRRKSNTKTKHLCVLFWSLKAPIPSHCNCTEKSNQNILKYFSKDKKQSDEDFLGETNSLKSSCPMCHNTQQMLSC